MDFKERVVLVTGASTGLGREYAVDLARRGAAVVVSARRHGPAPSRLDQLVEEIARAGGTAVAVHADVATAAGGQAMVDAALERFGRLDVVINNAGIVLPDSFADATLDDLDVQLDVHVRGAFHLSRVAYTVMREAGYGRFVFTSSPAAVFGRAGVVGYVIAKMGVLGMANVVGLEGESHGIRANTLLPMARSRMAGMVPPDPADRAFLEVASPELVTPMVTYLASEACTVNRRVFWAAAGRYAEAFVGLTDGWLAPMASVPEPEDIEAHIGQIACRDDHGEHGSLNEAMDAFLNDLRAARTAAAR